VALVILSWELELGTWNLELGTWNLELGLGLGRTKNLELIGEVCSVA